MQKVTWKDIPERIVHVHVVKEDVLQIVGLETALGATAAKLLENLALQFRFVVRQGQMLNQLEMTLSAKLKLNKTVLCVAVS